MVDLEKKVLEQLSGGDSVRASVIANRIGASTPDVTETLLDLLDRGMVSVIGNEYYESLRNRPAFRRLYTHRLANPVTEED